MGSANNRRWFPWPASLLLACAGADGGSASGTDGTTETPTTDGGTPTTDGGTMSGPVDTTASGTDEITADGTGTTDSNAPPVAVDDVAFATQDATLRLNVASGVLGNDTDPDGGLLTVVDFDAVSVGGATVVLDNDGAVTYGPAAGFWGPDSFEYTIQDDAGASASATVTVYVAPVQIPLAEVAGGLGGFVLDGEAGADGSGRSVSGAGDVNGDGMADLIVGSGADPNGDGSGRSYVVFGTADMSAVQLSAVAAGSGGFALDGEAASDGSGRAVACAGDVNGDGADDLIVGARGAGPNGDESGRSYVVFGKPDTTAVQLSAIAAGVGGFSLDGEAAGDASGLSVSGARDVNGDGMDDLIVGARGADPNGDSSGRSYVVFGKADPSPVQLSAIARGVGGFVLDGEAAGDFSGSSVGGAGDVNGDGMADLIIGALGAATANGDSSGRSYVVFGKTDTSAVQLSAIAAGAGGFVLDGEAIYDSSGASVSGAGDVNGDGMDDLIIGASMADPNGPQSGRSYVVFGKPDTSAVQLSAITAGMGGFVLDGEAAADRAGGSVSGAGDVNGDGMDDLLVGARDASPNGFNSGRSYVVFGKADTAAVHLGAIQGGQGGFVLDGEAASDESGGSVSGAGDVNGDGVDDLIIGARLADFNGDESGRSYVVFGVRTTAD